MRKIGDWWLSMIHHVKNNKEVLELLLTAIAILVAWWLLKETQKQVNESKTANTITDNALRFQIRSDSLNRIEQAKRDSVNNRSQQIRDSLNLESFMLENKAYLSIVSIDPPSVGKRIGVLIMISNSGKTPAIILNSAAVTGFGTEGFPDSKIVTFTKTIVNNFQIHSGIRYALWAFSGENEMIFGESDSINVYSRRVNLYVAGEINYADIFGRKYCLRFNVAFDPIHKQFGNYDHKK